jgi:dTDP-4-dehydrorhamnose reductase
MIGIDYYLTSDRMLDHRLDLHPDEPVGGNGRQSYIDIAAARSDVPNEKTGLASRIMEVWERYRLPIAVTELHNGCTRDEHLRWFMDGWNVALELRQAGIDLRAITSWSLFGARDWNSMLTREEGYYECGAFDARYSPPHPTIVASAIAHLAKDGHFDHPVLDRPGWWRKDGAARHAARPLVLAGFDRASSEIEECCSRRRLRVVPSPSMTNHAELFEQHKAWAMVRIERGITGPDRKKTPLRLHCEFAEGHRMSLELPSSVNWRHFADTFLDLVVDRRNGHLRCISKPKSNVMNALVEALPGEDAETRNRTAQNSAA